MIVGIPKETAPGEKRVACVPAAAAKLIQAGVEVCLERGAGVAASYTDAAYEKVGVRLADSAEACFGQSDLVAKVNAPLAQDGDRAHEADLLREGAALVSFLFPGECRETIDKLRQRKITSFGMELIPRITRAQSMDALSSMSSIAGYRAALIAADLLPKFFPMLMTAAGTIQPARVLVLGAGVAGLQAIATARRLGAVVEAFDVRPVVKEQVESLGARFVRIEFDDARAEDRGGYAKEQSKEQQEAIRRALLKHISKSDAVITTALVPGKKAPVLITTEMVEAMAPGSVIVDLAAEQGGNCELTVPGRTSLHADVTLAGPRNLPSSVAIHASDMYARNIATYIDLLVKDGELHLDLEDELIREPMVTHEGEIVHERTRDLLAGSGNQD